MLVLLDAPADVGGAAGADRKDLCAERRSLFRGKPIGGIGGIGEVLYVPQNNNLLDSLATLRI